MGKMFDACSTQDSLYRAWRTIRANGFRSKSSETRDAVEDFERTANRDIKRIQARLRDGSFQFTPQQGVTKRKASGSKRGIVMASVHNRIVERSLLDTLQEHSPFVRTVNKQATSFGGVPHRSVPHALKFLNEAFNGGYQFFVRSDISGFFDHVPRHDVIAKIRTSIDDAKFLDLLTEATTVTLANEAALGEDRSVFPTDDEGVAQGSPLSPLFGNILLHDFDVQFNQREILCARFIDDFVILGKSKAKVQKAFQSAKAHLKGLGLDCHDPYDAGANAAKTELGEVQNGFDFLGYNCRRGLFQPSDKARNDIKETVDAHLASGRDAITKVRRDANSFAARQRYAQTLSLVDRVLKGWGESFAYGNSSNTLEDLDRQIDEKLESFRSWFARNMKDADWKARRRMGGICLLSDIKAKTFDDVPFIVGKSDGVRATSRSITVSTDGALASFGRQGTGDLGPGGWAFVVHDAGEERSGSEARTTNNRMELMAVIEAIRHVQGDHPLVIRTDSRYVEGTVNKSHPIRKNADLWRAFEEAKGSRKIKIVWVKGHSGDPHNERADQLASARAQEAKFQAEINMIPDQFPEAADL